MYALKRLDTFSEPGKRNAAEGIQTAGAALLLKNFNFNACTALNTVIKKDIQANMAKGNLQLTGLLPKRDITYPKGATHAELKAVLARVDLKNKKFALKEAMPVMLAKKDRQQDVMLKVKGTAEGQGADLFVLSIEFYQETNGVLYALNNSSFNACAVVGFRCV